MSDLICREAAIGAVLETKGRSKSPQVLQGFGEGRNAALAALRALPPAQEAVPMGEQVADLVRGVWACCEAAEDEAHAKLAGDLSDHERGYFTGQRVTAKRIRRATDMPPDHYGDGNKMVPAPPFRFDRYIDGQLMAEGVRIEKQNTLDAAMRAAARLAAKGPKGQVPVLVYDAPAAPAVKVKPLPRADGHDRSPLGWTLQPDDLMAIRKEAGSWAEGVYLGTVQAIALAVEARILAALEGGEG